MNNNQYQYNQPPMGQGMPPQMPLQQRFLSKIRGGQNIFPKWLSQYPVAVYVLALLIISFIYAENSLPWYYMLAGIVSILAFFMYGSSVSTNTAVEKMTKTRKFEKYIFLVALVPRVVFTLLLYYIFQQTYGNEFGFENADAVFYDDIGEYVAGMISSGKFNFYTELSDYANLKDASDMGYGVYVGIVYWLMGKSIIGVRLLKCVWSSLTVLLMYRLAKRNFGEQTGRVTAIFIALWPNFWYYCAVHLKEVEMVFLAVLFVEQAEQMLRSRQFTVWKIVPILLIAATMFTFRMPLGLVALLALIFSVVMSSQKVVSWGKRIVVGTLALILIAVVAGNEIQEQSRGLFEQVQSGSQEQNMEWRSKRDNGNMFAKYAGTAVFAPMIFTLPFPTFVKPYEGQDVQQLLNGGNFVKNIISAFTIFALVMLLLSGQWREHLLPLSFMLGYLVVLSASTFAQSERFHQPAMPFEFMFAAYGLSIAVTKKKYKRWFTYWCVLMFVAAIAWNWFKLAGRGLV